MKHWTFLYILMACWMFGCGRQKPRDQHSATQDSTGIDDNDRLVCILWGPDSIIYYHGSSSRMQDVKRGVLSDTVFTEALFRTAKRQGYMLTVKPGDGHDVLSNFKTMIDLANDHGIINRTVGIIDANEEKAFGVSTAPPIESAIKGEKQELKLNLPKDDPANADTALNNIPKASRMIVLVAGDDGLYVYQGDNMQQGKKYTFEGLTDMLKTKAKDRRLFVALRPSARCSYKNTVDALDMMKTAGIEHYGLFDIKKEEEDYLRQIYR